VIPDNGRERARQARVTHHVTRLDHSTNQIIAFNCRGFVHVPLLYGCRKDYLSANTPSSVLFWVSCAWWRKGCRLGRFAVVRELVQCVTAVDCVRVVLFAALPCRGVCCNGVLFWLVFFLLPPASPPLHTCGLVLIVDRCCVVLSRRTHPRTDN